MNIFIIFKKSFKPIDFSLESFPYLVVPAYLKHWVPKSG